LIDPRRRGGGPQIDEWLPIKPGTDLALALALAHVLVKRGYIDREYLTAHTNAPFLVQEDGHFFRVDGKEQVWDQASQSPQPPDTPGVQPALEGTFTHEGRTLKTAFQVFKEHIEPYTPEWAGPICGLDPEQIRKVAEELGQNALIGSTIVLEGVRLPYRPVGAMAYHMAQQELGFQAIRAIVIVFMLLGAIEAVGGLRSSFDRKVHPNFHALDTITIKEPPYNIYLKESKYFPINSNNSSLVAKVMLDPHKYGVNDVPEVCIVHMTNPAVAYADSPVVWEAYKRLKFVVVIDPWLSKTADLFADVVLPAATIEKYEGPLNVTDQYVEALSVRVPPIEPLFDSRGEIEIYLDLCEKAGILYGEGGYLDHLNKALNLKDPYTLDLTKKPTVREIFDRWARSTGFAQGIEYFEKYGVSVKPIPVHKLYACAWDPPYGGIRHRLYGESLLRYREEMRAAGAEEIYWRDYTPLPTWRPPTMEESPPLYDLYLISAKKIEHKQSRSSQIPLLAELAPTQYVAINPKTARERGIADGDWVWVESHNAVTGETRRLKVQARFYEGIRPDTVAMPHHYREVARHPWAKDQGPSPNYLFFTGEGYVGMTADQSFCGFCLAPASTATTRPAFGFIFGLMVGRPGWFSALQAPGFVVMAGVSGVGMLILIAAFLRRALGETERLSERVFRWLSTFLMVLVLVYLYFMVVELLTSTYTGHSHEVQLTLSLLWGEYAWLYWGAVGALVGSVLVPLLWRSSIASAVVAGLLVNVAAIAKRVLIVVPSQTHGGLLPYGTGSYTPTWVEYSIVVGLFALGTLLYSIFVKVFPIMEIEGGRS
jgi:anaerobic selenocysteine-containing dehydrogenase